MLVKKEKEIENEILNYLSLYPTKVVAWKNQTIGVFDSKKGIYRRPNNRHHRKGIPDIVGYIMVPGRTAIPLFIEVKSKTGKLSPEQATFLSEASMSGCVAFVARDVEAVIAVMEPYLVDA